MLGRYHYHSIFRKSIIAFGTLFNNILVKRKGSGSTLEAFKVPIKYGPTQKFLAMIAAEPGVQREDVQMTLPRMSFEIKGLIYDGSRKLPPTTMVKVLPPEGSDEADTNKQYTQYLPVPYNLQVEMSIISKTQDDGLQILEQILPNFHPSVNVSIQVIEETKEERDIAIVLDGVNYEDRYEGNIEERRFLVWTLIFTVKTYLFGPVDIQKDIRRVQVDYRTDIKQRQTELRYVAEVESTDEPPVPRDEINPETDGWKVNETYEDIHAQDSDFFGL